METFKHEITEGEDLKFPIFWKEKESGNPIDLTGSQIIFKSEDGTFDQTATINDAANGEYEFYLPSSETFGSIDDGVKKTLRYKVKHISSGGLISFLFNIEILVVGLND